MTTERALDKVLTLLKYLTVVSSVFGKVFSKSRARSGSFNSPFMSVMTFCGEDGCYKKSTDVERGNMGGVETYFNSCGIERPALRTSPPSALHTSERGPRYARRSHVRQLESPNGQRPVGLLRIRSIVFTGRCSDQSRAPKTPKE